MKSKQLPRSFYSRPADQVARELLGMHLVFHRGKSRFRLKIVETEAYLGEKDLASHASKGCTARTRIMYGTAGHAYIYLIYGMYNMFNVVTAEKNNPHAVLIRAAECLSHPKLNLSGPGKLTKAIGITRKLNGADFLGKQIYFERGEPSSSIVSTTRIGVDYAKEWAKVPLRFYDGESLSVSKKPKS